MIHLMFAAALMDTVIAPPPEFETVYVHEWGAITFCEDQITLGSIPETDQLEPYTEPDDSDHLVVRAPVVYFYGAPFTGSFQVSLPSGSFIETLPTPESISWAGQSSESINLATWRINGSTQEFPEDGSWSSIDGTSITPELLQSWRLPPCMTLTFPEGVIEKFVYYEAALAEMGSDDLYPVLLTEQGAVLHPDYDGPFLRFEKTLEGVEVLDEDGEPVFRGLLDDYSVDAFFQEVLCQWAGGSMKSQEIQAIWETWKSWILEGGWNGDTLLVFPLPYSSAENVSSVYLETDQNFNVEYERFFIGILSQ